jgi:hypothetical protein
LILLPLTMVRAQGKRRLDFVGGLSREMLADAAKLAGELAARHLLAALSRQRPRWERPSGRYSLVPGIG